MEGQLRDSQNLEDLSFNSNQLRSVPKAARSLLKLRTLDLGENKIVRLESGDFNSLSELYGLRLAGNELTTLSRAHFANVSGLHVLNIAHNNLKNIEQGGFDHLQELRALRLDNNRLKDIFKKMGLGEAPKRFKAYLPSLLYVLFCHRTLFSKSRRIIDFFLT